MRLRFLEYLSCGPLFSRCARGANGLFRIREIRIQTTDTISVRRGREPAARPQLEVPSVRVTLRPNDTSQ